MAGQRRLFITHAGELAHLMARAVGPGAMVARFIRSYAERHKRLTFLADSQQLREMESTIGREALLVMAVEARRRMPRAFASGSRGPRPDEVALAETFAQEFLASLGRIVAGTSTEGAAERTAFDHELELYDRWTLRRSPRTAAPGDAPESPFPDRCAMLLDPSMMEAARREAADFEIQLAHEGARIFDHLGRHGLRPTSPVRRVHRPARRVKAARRPVLRKAVRKAARGPRRKSTVRKPSVVRKSVSRETVSRKARSRKTQSRKTRSRTTRSRERMTRRKR